VDDLVDDFTELIDLAGERLGGAVVWANDEFFAPKEALVREAEPVWEDGRYTERGKWMDGWETRRRRTPGHDRCIVRLGARGVVRGVVVDTRHFRGNQPEACAIDAVDLPGAPAVETLLAEDLGWRPLLPHTPLGPDAPHPLPVEDDAPATHLRFSIYPDGGVARLRVHGVVAPDWPRLAARGEVDLAAAAHGGRVVAASDGTFGRPGHLILSGSPRGMHDGWETRRRRGPGHDWAVVELGRPGRPHRVEVDTTHFRGNAPASCALDGCSPGDWAGEATAWRELLPRTPLQPHALHDLPLDPPPAGPVSHVRLSIHPDGGVARLRVFATVEASSRTGAAATGTAEPGR